MADSTGGTAAAFASTAVDEWVRSGICDAVIAPGSRSTPLTVALLNDSRVRCHVFIDERSAGFCALGIGRATGRPAPIVTTSGTAAVNLHPAVVEAHHADVPMLICTADRPPELQGVGAPQTIDQRQLYGVATRAAIDVTVPDRSEAGQWRQRLSEAVRVAMGSPPGPVHLNMAFREPLLGSGGSVPAGREDGEPWSSPSPVGSERRAAPADLRPILDGLAAARGVIVAGAGCDGSTDVRALADELGWPVLADPLSGMRTPHARVVAAFDGILREPAVAAALTPDVVLRLGRPPASKVLGAWIETVPQELVVAQGAEPSNPRHAPVVLRAWPAAIASEIRAARQRSSTRPPPDPAWVEAWRIAEGAAQAAVDATLGAVEAEDGVTEPGLARIVVDACPVGGNLVVSSSMPVRDVEWFGRPRSGLTTISNRGANGIDGVTSTAVGVALAGGPTTALLGDLAFLHDTNALLGLDGRDVDLSIVVLDNDGGGIFSFLPQAELLDATVFEEGWGTAHGLDLGAVAEAHGVAADRADRPGAIEEWLSVRPGGARILVVPGDRARNVDVHRRLERAVSGAVAEALLGRDGSGPENR